MRRAKRLAGRAAAAWFALALVAGAGTAARQDKNLDLFWSHAEIARLAPRTIALLPAATYNYDLKAEKEIELSWSQATRGGPHRWIYSTLAKDMLREAFGGDSVLKALRESILKDGRVDSLSARALCRALRRSAVLCMRADQWEQIEMEWNQTGTPSTTVHLKAALVDSGGRLLWTTSGSHTGEGPMHQAEGGTIGVRSSGLTMENVTGQGGAPAFREVLAPLFTRWLANFPAPASETKGQAAPEPDAGP